MSNHDSIKACNFVLFGGNGDLAIRKILPALYFLDMDGHLSEETTIIGGSRSAISDSDYRQMIKEGVRTFVSEQYFDDMVWERFARRLSYICVDATQPDSFYELKIALEANFQSQLTIYYLSTPSEVYGAICQCLDQHGLVNSHSRVVLEKPIGHNLASSKIVNDAVGAIFPEENIYRIDHYLGKETVQNLIALRFANALFEPVWSNAHISNVQISVPETVGAGGRLNYYDKAGALRDMVQNHLLQLLCLVAMGVPVNLDAESVRAEKIKVLKSLDIIQPETINEKAIRAQYTSGTVDGKAVPGYTQEDEANPDSNTETYVAIRADIHNWRWRGVPFYLRTGKRLPNRYSEIVIEFRDVPHSIFPKSANLLANKLVIRLQPEESIKLFKMNKVPGLSAGMRVMPVTLNLTLPENITTARPPDAHERLIFDIIQGDSTLFVHRDELEAAWRWCDAILEGWNQQALPLHKYAAGSWGPQAGLGLTARYGHSWHESE
jgi:glucose-6-phosphate 1-dehydrogenase